MKTIQQQMLTRLLEFFTILGITTMFGSTGYSQIISQYVETNSGTTPKGIEIWNNTGSDIVFSPSNNLQIFQGTNGVTCIALGGTNVTSGTLEAGKVWIIGTNDIITYLSPAPDGSGPFPDVSGSTTFGFAFNGNDALQVRLGGVVMDEFGTCGSDPVSNWSGSGVSTANQNIELLDGITTGDTDGWTNPSIRFSTVSSTPVTLPAGLSGFGIAPETVLPITLLDFTAEVVLGDVLLEWTTVSEINNDYFVLQHSIDGLNWQPVNQQAGAGTTTSQTDYNFLHEKPVAGTNYYRLLQADFDGTVSHSEIVTVYLQSGGNSLGVYPNPATDHIMIGQGVQLSVYNTVGQLVLEAMDNGNGIRIRDLAPGIYLARLFAGSNSKTVKLIVE